MNETGDQSFISQVQNLISQAQNQPSRSENIASKLYGWLFHIAVIIALIAFVVWMVIEDTNGSYIYYYYISYCLSARIGSGYSIGNRP